MRIFVKDLIAELQKCEPNASVEFRVNVSTDYKPAEPIVFNHLGRVNNLGSVVQLIPEHGA